MQHLILTGTNQQIDRSKTLARLINNCNNVSIISWFDNKSVDDVFDAENFNLVDLVLVYVERPFPYIDFFLFHKTNLKYSNSIEFVFIEKVNPFEVTTPITNNFLVKSVTLSDDQLLSDIPELSLMRIDNKISNLITMIDEIKQGDLFSYKEKEMFCDFYKKQIIHQHKLRLEYADYSTKEVLNQIEVNIN